MTFDSFLNAVAKLRKVFPEITRLAIVGAGIVMTPIVIWITYIIWKGPWSEKVIENERLQVILKQLDILGVIAVIAAILLGVVIVALVGVVNYVKAELPGASFQIGLDDNPEADKEPK